MALRITALFSQPEPAQQALDELESAGIDGVRIDRQSTSIGPSETLNIQHLIQLGIAGAEATFYADLIAQGATLLVLTTEFGRADEVATLLKAAGLLEVSTADEEQRLRFESPEIGTDKSPLFINESRPRQDGADTDAEGARKVDNKSSLPEDSSLPQPLDTGGDDRQRMASRSSLPGPYDKFEEAFRIHYDNHFVTSPFTYDRFLKAYRYGLLLAHEESFDDMSWETLEPYASESWDSQTNGPWPVFRPAVKYGWELRRQHSARPGQPPRS